MEVALIEGAIVGSDDNKLLGLFVGLALGSVVDITDGDVDITDCIDGEAERFDELTVGIDDGLKVSKVVGLMERLIVGIVEG